VQDYRTVRLHDPAECITCGPDQPGHYLCQHPECDELAEMQYPRHATEQEYAALPEEFQPVDGIAHRAVFVCGDHEPDPICGAADHPAPLPISEGLAAACTRCAAGPGEHCLKANGGPRTVPHSGRSELEILAHVGPCRHVHRENCGGLGSCACRADDPAPDRPKRIVAPPVKPGPPPMHVGIAGPLAAFFADHGIDMNRVTSLAPEPGPDGTMLLRATMLKPDPHGNPIFDADGRPETETVEVSFQPLPDGIRSIPPPDGHAAAAG
jgi:hypothetical protein